MDQGKAGQAQGSSQQGTFGAGSAWPVVSIPGDLSSEGLTVRDRMGPAFHFWPSSYFRPVVIHSRKV